MANDAVTVVSPSGLPPFLTVTGQHLVYNGLIVPPTATLSGSDDTDYNFRELLTALRTRATFR